MLSAFWGVLLNAREVEAESTLYFCLSPVCATSLAHVVDGGSHEAFPDLWAWEPARPPQRQKRAKHGGEKVSMCTAPLGGKKSWKSGVWCSLLCS